MERICVITKCVIYKKRDKIKESNYQAPLSSSSIAVKASSSSSTALAASEAENDARALKSLEHEQDPVAHPETGSKTASLITIRTENLNRLKVPSFLNSFREWVYPSLANLLADEELRDREEKSKRKASSDDKQSPEESRANKRRCMDGSSHVERIIGAFMPVDFANSLFDTELHVAVPLPFFLNRNNLTHCPES